MYKLVLLVSIMIIFTACNNSSKTQESSKFEPIKIANLDTWISEADSKKFKELAEKLIIQYNLKNISIL